MKRSIKYRTHTEYLTTIAAKSREGVVTYTLRFVKGRSAKDAQMRARQTMFLSDRLGNGVRVTVLRPQCGKINVGELALAALANPTTTEAQEYGSLLLAAAEQVRLVESGAAL